MLYIFLKIDFYVSFKSRKFGVIWAENHPEELF